MCSFFNFIHINILFVKSICDYNKYTIYKYSYNNFDDNINIIGIKKYSYQETRSNKYLFNTYTCIKGVLAIKCIYV